jgi:ABC-2 type transport system permease protein
VLYYWDLYVNYWRLFVKTLAQYRADVAITICAAAVQEGAGLLFIGIVFSNIQQLQGWTFAEVLMTWGLMTIATGLWNVTLDVPHRVQGYLRRGELDYLLVRPPGILFQIAGTGGLNPTSIGRVVIGVVALATALREQGVAFEWWWALYLPAVVVSGVLLVFSVFLMIACLNFWFTNVDSLLTTFAWTAQLGRFPITIFGPVLQFLLTWVLPFAMLGFYPAAFLLRGGAYRPYGLIALVIGWVFLGLALAVWRVAMRRYQSTGS